MIANMANQNPPGNIRVKRLDEALVAVRLLFLFRRYPRRPTPTVMVLQTSLRKTRERQCRSATRYEGKGLG
jgi:hypothetical protein